MNSFALIGVDVGTTRVKAVAVALDGTVLATASAPTPWVVDGARVEMGADTLADTARSVIAETASACPERSVVGVGVTGIGESGVLLDGAGRPVAPIVAWYDQRGDIDRVVRELPELTVRTGVPANPTATVFKLAACTDELPGRRWLNVPEWVISALGGEHFAEMSLAGRTGLQEHDSGTWWPDALELLGIDEHFFPGEARLGVEGAGVATFGPVAGARLVVAGHDHQVAAFAAGATDPGCLFESLGTADALAVAVVPPVDPAVVAEIVGCGATIGRTVVADRLIVIVGMRTGQILERIGRLAGMASGPERRELSARAARLDPDPALTVTLAGGSLSITGIGNSTGPEELWRAAVAAADARTAEYVARFERWFGRPDRVVLGGGWLHDPAVAAATQRRFPGARHTDSEEPGAVGAAAMAGIAAGVLERPFAASADVSAADPITQTRITQTRSAS